MKDISTKCDKLTNVKKNMHQKTLESVLSRLSDINHNSARSNESVEHPVDVIVCNERFSGPKRGDVHEDSCKNGSMSGLSKSSTEKKVVATETVLPRSVVSHSPSKKDSDSALIFNIREKNHTMTRMKKEKNHANTYSEYVLPWLISSDYSDDGSEGSLKSYARKCISTMDMILESMRNSRKKRVITPFQLLCRHVNRTLFYSVFGNSVDGYTCSVCDHFTRDLRCFLLHMKIHKDVCSLLEKYLKLGGKVIALEMPGEGEESLPDVQSEVSSEAQQHVAAKNDILSIPECSMSVKDAENDGNSANSTSVKQEQVDLNELTLQSPNLPTLDVTDTQSVKLYAKAFCDYITNLQPTLKLYKKNGVTAFEILCKYLDRKHLYDIFDKRYNHFVCMYCSQLFQLQYLMAHMRRYQDLTLLLETYLSKGGRLVFDQSKSILPRDGYSLRRMPKVKNASVDKQEAEAAASVASTNPFGLRPDRNRLSWKMSSKRLQKRDQFIECETRRKVPKYESQNALKTIPYEVKFRGHMNVKLSATLPVAVVKQEPRDHDAIPIEPSTSKIAAGSSATRIRRRRLDGFNTKALEPKIFEMLNSLVKEGITERKPHFCMYCARPFYSGTGIYLHYYCHKRKPTKNDYAVFPKKFEAKNNVNSSVLKLENDWTSDSQLCLQPADGMPTTSLPISQRKLKKESNCSTSQDIKKKIRSKRNRPFPTKLLPLETVNMLQNILKSKITKDNPHYCRHCGRTFYNGCGIYAHYYLHEKVQTSEQSSANYKYQSVLGIVKVEPKSEDEDLDADPAQRSHSPADCKFKMRHSQSTPVASKRRPNRGKFNDLVLVKKRRHSMPLPKQILDPQTLRMLNNTFNKKITPQNPHYCKVCNRCFNSGCGLYMHYYLHWKEREKSDAGDTSGEPSSSVIVPSVEAGPSSSLPEQSVSCVSTGDTPVDDAAAHSDGRSLDDRGPVADSKTVQKLAGRTAKETTTPENPNRCTVCGRVFLNRRGMNKHYLGHEMQKSKSTNSSGSTSKSFDSKEPARRRRGNCFGMRRDNITSVTSVQQPTVNDTTTESPEENEASRNHRVPAFSTESVLSGSQLDFHFWQQQQKQQTKLLDDSQVPQVDDGPAACSSSEDVVTLATAAEELEKDDKALLELQHNTKKLLYCLAKDAYTLKELGWPNRDVSEVVADILTICNVAPARMPAPNNVSCLRENVSKLLKFCIKDEVMVKHSWEGKLVDDVVKELISSETELITL